MKEIKEKSKALGLAIEKLEKTYGQGTIMKLSDENIVKIPNGIDVNYYSKNLKLYSHLLHMHHV